MRNTIVSIGLSLLTAAVFSGCTSALYTSYNNDDLYGTHDRAAIAKAEARQAEIAKAEAEARRAKYEALIAQAEAESVENQYYGRSDDGLDYGSVLADTYESAYARRLRGFESPTYNMPSSYYNFRYNGAYTYVSAYDPAQYNVIIMGDQVWVEPKYITSMFGNWGTVVNFSFGWRNPWSYYYSPWYYPSSWYWNSWYNPWYDNWWSWGYGWGWHGPYYDYWWPHYGPGHFHPSHGGGSWHGPHHSGRPGTIYRSAYRTSGTLGGGSGVSYRQNGVRNGSATSAGGSYRTRYDRSNGNASNASSGNGSYRSTRSNNRSDYSPNSEGVSSRYRNNGSSSRSSSSRPSYSSPGSSRSSGSYGGGSSSGGGGSRSGGGYGSGGSSSRGR